MVFLLLFNISALAQSHLPPAEHETLLDEVRKRPCDIPVATGFSCAVVFNVGSTPYEGMIASIVGEDVSEISLYLGGMLYTIAYDPPLKRDAEFFRLRRGMQVPVRVESNFLIVQWPNHTRSKGKILRREAVFPNQPQPA
jgi:hypothetical protein